MTMSFVKNVCEVNHENKKKKMFIGERYLSI